MFVNVANNSRNRDNRFYYWTSKQNQVTSAFVIQVAYKMRGGGDDFISTNFVSFWSNSIVCSGLNQNFGIQEN
jgi:hypothetical protein